MSVVAWDGKWVVTDKRATSPTGGHMKVIKHKLLPDGTILAGVGNYAEVHTLFEWYGTDDPYPDFQQVDDYNTLLVVTQDGRGYVYSHLPVPLEVFPPFAMGAGGDLALGAMWAGASASVAVNIACRCNVFCGDGIYHIRVGATEPTEERSL